MKHTAMRWTIGYAAKEFGISPKSLSSRIHVAGIVPGADDKFSTAEICEAAFGDINGEKLRLVKEQADSQALKNQTTRRELLPVEDVRSHFAAVVIALRSGILASNLDKPDKNELLLNLKRLCENVRVKDESDRESIKADEPDLEPTA